MVDYYKALGLQKNASQDDTRKSYRRLALQWHPDKNPSNKEEAEKKFKAVAEAYEVLSDPQKRSLYDRSVKESISHRARSPSMAHNSFFDASYVFQDPNEIFRDFFGGMDPFVHAFWDPFDNLRNGDENKQGPSGRGSCSSLVSDVVQSFMPFNPFSPSEQPTSSFAEDMAEPHSFRSVLTTTEGINGKKVTTRKIIENRQETIEMEEDGHLRSETIEMEKDGHLRSETIEMEEDGHLRSETIEMEEDGHLRSETIEMEEDGHLRSETIEVEEDGHLRSVTINGREHLKL